MLPESAVDGAADGEVAVEGDELLPGEIAGLDQLSLGQTMTGVGHQHHGLGAQR